MKTRCGSLASFTQQLVLLRREHDALAADGDPPRRAVDLDLPRFETLDLGRRHAPQDRADARDQLVVVEGPVEIVVAATVEGTHAVDRIRLRAAEQDHGHLAVPGAAGLALAKPAAELGALRVADQHEVGTRLLQEIERLTVLRADDVEPVLAQVSLEEAPRRFLRLVQQERARHMNRR